MDVADLLELEGTLQGNWIVDAPAEEDHILGALKPVGQASAALVVIGHQGLELLGQLPQLGHQGFQTGAAAARTGAMLLFAQPALGKGQGQAIESQQLGQEGFGGCHPHLNARSDIEDVIHHPGQGALRPVGDPQQPGGKGWIRDQLAPLLLHGQGRQGVCRFP